MKNINEQKLNKAKRNYKDILKRIAPYLPKQHDLKQKKREGWKVENDTSVVRHIQRTQRDNDVQDDE